MSTSLSIEKISAIAISVLVVGVLAYKAIFEGDAQSTTALIALASPAAAVAVIRRQETLEAPSPAPSPSSPTATVLATVPAQTIIAPPAA